ncbi:hypothetical protein K458DRAFT_392635 [Lentithecium fluviatile CBS 122367]|uniref:Uncharacterized protein n=1 Tax=Lentithecium fluviatile CBS 122367 TaxID=1168545 RepID=A0A6G1IQQ7_9PLEO|nr:hypothetical protein K458DRAFT_392635 [Lentithecium fluviatile CBS 122367]
MTDSDTLALTFQRQNPQLATTGPNQVTQDEKLPPASISPKQENWVAEPQVDITEVEEAEVEKAKEEAENKLKEATKKAAEKKGKAKEACNKAEEAKKEADVWRRGLYYSSSRR